MDDDVNEFMIAGVDGVIVKPLHSEQLDKIIEFVQAHGNNRLWNASASTASSHSVAHSLSASLPFLTTASGSPGYMVDGEMMLMETL